MVIYLAGVEIILGEETQSGFERKITIMDILAMAKFFYLICKALFVSFLAFRKLKRKLLGLVSNYFAIIETNGHGMLHLHYLVWLKEVTPLVTIRSQTQDNHEFFQRLFAIFDHIIKYSASLNPHLEII